MKFKTSSKTLKEAFSKLSNVIGKSVLPIINNFYFNLKGNTITAIATDLTHYIVLAITVRGSEDGEACVNAKLVSDIISSFDCDLSFELQKNTLIINAENSRFEIATEDPDDYPRNADLKKMKAFILTSENVKNLLKVSHSASTDELRANMSGILTKVDKDKIIFVATDGHRLSVVEDFLTNGAGATSFQLLLTLKTVSIIGKYGTSKEKSVTVEYNDEFVKFTIDSMILISKLNEDTFPNYETVLPTEFDSQITAETKDFKQAVRRASLINADELTMEFSGKNAILTAGNSELGLKSEQKVKLSKNTDDTVFNMSPDYLLQCIEETNGDKLNIQVNSTRQLIQVKDGNFFEIIMQRRRLDSTVKQAKTKTETPKQEEKTQEINQEVKTETTPKKTRSKKAKAA